MRNDTYECPKILLNVDKNEKIVIESDLCANECLFSLNEQQKVYYINQGCILVPQGMKR